MECGLVHGLCTQVALKPDNVGGVIYKNRLPDDGEGAGGFEAPTIIECYIDYLLLNGEVRFQSGIPEEKHGGCHRIWMPLPVGCRRFRRFAVMIFSFREWRKDIPRRIGCGA